MKDLLADNHITKLDLILERTCNANHDNMGGVPPLDDLHGEDDGIVRPPILLKRGDNFIVHPVRAHNATTIPNGGVLRLFFKRPKDLADDFQLLQEPGQKCKIYDGHTTSLVMPSPVLAVAVVRGQVDTEACSKRRGQYAASAQREA